MFLSGTKIVLLRKHRDSLINELINLMLHWFHLTRSGFLL